MHQGFSLHKNRDWLLGLISRRMSKSNYNNHQILQEFIQCTTPACSQRFYHSSIIHCCTF